MENRNLNTETRRWKRIAIYRRSDTGRQKMRIKGKLIFALPLILFFSSYPTQSQTLQDYYTIAAEKNPGLQSKYKEFEAAMEKIPQVSSLPDPTFSFGYFISSVETRVGPQRARFSLTQMFPWFGTLKAQGDAATLMAEAKYQAFLDARNKLFYKVAAAYYPLYELKEWQRIEEENVQILESYKSIATNKFQNGTGTMVDVLRADLLLKASQTSLKILNEKENSLLTTFNKLLNRESNAPVNLSDTSDTYNNVNLRKDSLLLGNPLIKSLDLKAQSSEAGKLAAQKQGLPKIGVGVDYVIVGERTDMDLTDNGKDVLMPMVSVSIPIFRKKYKAMEKEAELMEEAYTFQKDDAVNFLFSEYERIRFKLEQKKAEIELYEIQVQESEQALNLLFTAYGNSGKDFEEVLNMQQQLLKYEKMLISAQSEFHIAVAELNYITAKNY